MFSFCFLAVGALDSPQSVPMTAPVLTEFKASTEPSQPQTTAEQPPSGAALAHGAAEAQSDADSEPEAELPPQSAGPKPQAIPMTAPVMTRGLCGSTTGTFSSMIATLILSLLFYSSLEFFATHPLGFRNGQRSLYVLCATIKSHFGHGAHPQGQSNSPLVSIHATTMDPRR